MQTNYDQNKVVAKYILKDLILHFNDEKCQTLTMLQLNVVDLNTRNILIFNNYTSCTIILRKNIVARCTEFYCKRPTD